MLETLTAFVTVLLALSVASERLVELIKGFSEHLTGKKVEAGVERKRQLQIHGLSLLTSAIVVWLSQDYIVATLKLTNWNVPQATAFTILASGGSSMWNSILSYLLSIKNLKQQDVVTGEKVGNADLAKGLPVSMPTIA
jgi:hypothetical protein